MGSAVQWFKQFCDNTDKKVNKDNIWGRVLYSDLNLSLTWLFFIHV